MEIAFPVAAVLLLVTIVGALLGIGSWLRCTALTRRIESLEAAAARQ